MAHYRAKTSTGPGSLTNCQSAQAANEVIVISNINMLEDNSFRLKPPFLPRQAIRLDTVARTQLADGFGKIITHRAM